jgi:chaperone modulatory protein CbpM
MTEWKIIQGEPLDDTTQLTLTEVCSICGVHEALVIEMVEEGLVEPVGQPEWIFSGVAVARIQTAIRLQQDLDINLSAVALTLDLLDEIHRLRRRLNIQAGPLG